MRRLQEGHSVHKKSGVYAMTDRTELRRLAEASFKAEETWHHEADLHGSLACTYGEAGEHYVEQDAAYIAAASPEVVLGLLDERDQLRAVAVRLKEALLVYHEDDGIDADCIACQVLADPEVEKL